MAIIALVIVIVYNGKKVQQGWSRIQHMLLQTFFARRRPFDLKGSARGVQ